LIGMAAQVGVSTGRREAGAMQRYNLRQHSLKMGEGLIDLVTETFHELA
jgi:hypothetical protein